MLGSGDSFADYEYWYTPVPNKSQYGKPICYGKEASIVRMGNEYAENEGILWAETNICKWIESLDKAVWYGTQTQVNETKRWFLHCPGSREVKYDSPFRRVSAAR